MNCKDVIELLEAGLGITESSEEVEQHLDQCPDCMALMKELQSISRKVNQSSEFEFTPSEIEIAVAAVERRLDSASVDTIVSKSDNRHLLIFGNWLRPLVRTAAVVLFVGATYGAYKVGQLQIGTSLVPDSLTVSDNGPVESDWTGSDSEEMDAAMISTLINEFSDRGYFEAGEAILDDITDEEMEYFLENFDVGDIL